MENTISQIPYGEHYHEKYYRSGIPTPEELPYLQKLGLALKHERERRSLSLRELARLTGYSHGYLCDLEKGKKRPRPKTLWALSQTLGVDYRYLCELCGPALA